MARDLTVWSLILIVLPAILYASEPSAPHPAPRPPEAPSITSVTPDEIDFCRLQQNRSVSVRGHFPPGTLLFLDGSVVEAKVEENEIVFEAPPFQEGSHQIQAVAPLGRTSLPYSFTINSIPQISSVQKGRDKVTSYEIILTGRNLLFDSILVVNDHPINAVVPRDAASSYPLPEPLPGTDRVQYVDCTTLIYIRHPFSGEAKSLRFRIINPGGTQSNLFEAEFP